MDISLDLKQALLRPFRACRTPIDADIAGSCAAQRPVRPLPQRCGLAPPTAGSTSQGAHPQATSGTGRAPCGSQPRHARRRAAATVAGIDRLVTVLIDKTVGQASQRALDRYAPGLNLDRLLGPRGAALAAAGAAMRASRPSSRTPGRHAAAALRRRGGVSRAAQGRRGGRRCSECMRREIAEVYPGSPKAKTRRPAMTQACQFLIA
jgi:hypothetical protein